MKKLSFLFFIALLTSSISVSAQIQIDWLEIYEEEGPGGASQIYAINNGLCPLSVSFDFNVLKNLSSDKKLPVEIVIPNDKEGHLILTLKSKNPRKDTEYNFNIKYVIGDIFNTKHDDNHAYLLPFEKGKKYAVGQGYDGRFSHGGIKAIDFQMKESTKVCAARKGVVIAVKSDSGKGCRSKKCMNHANYILIYHEDGTFASYVHLKKNGAKVKIGDQVKAGQVIGLSGNTGWSSGPHLHFEVYRPGAQNRRTSIPTKFYIGKGKTDFLKEKNSYTSTHP